MKPGAVPSGSVRLSLRPSVAASTRGLPAAAEPACRPAFPARVACNPARIPRTSRKTPGGRRPGIYRNTCASSSRAPGGRAGTAVLPALRYLALYEHRLLEHEGRQRLVGHVHALDAGRTGPVITALASLSAALARGAATTAIAAIATLRKAFIIFTPTPHMRQGQRTGRTYAGSRRSNESSRGDTSCIRELARTRRDA